MILLWHELNFFPAQKQPSMELSISRFLKSFDFYQQCSLALVVLLFGIPWNWSVFTQVYFILMRSTVNNFSILYNELDDFIMAPELIDEMLPPSKKNRSESRNEYTWPPYIQRWKLFKQESQCSYQLELSLLRNLQNTFRYCSTFWNNRYEEYFSFFFFFFLEKRTTDSVRSRRFDISQVLFLCINSPRWRMVISGDQSSPQSQTQDCCYACTAPM